MSLRQNFWLVAAVMVMVALALTREVYFFPIPDMIPNPDVAWLMYAAERMVDGEKPYADFMETNPPLVMWINILPVYLGRLLDTPPLIVFPFIVTLLNLTSLCLVANILKDKRTIGETPNFQAVILYISFGYFLLSPAIYGQRELLFISLVLPYLIRTLEGDKDKENSAINIIITAMAAIGFALKPFFLLLWGLNELHVAINKHKISSIFALRNWFIGLIQIAYFASTYILYPEYINDIVPAILATYFTYESIWKSVLKFIAIVVGLVVAIFWIAKPHGDFKRVILRIMVWMLAGTGLMLLQRKEWLNHLYPLVFMAGFAITIIMMYLHEIWQDVGLMIGHRRFIALCVCVATLASCTWVDAKFWHFIYKHPSVIHTKLLKEINERADGKSVYSLAFNMQTAFPVIALSKGVFQGSFHQLWPLAGLIIREQQGIRTPEIIRANQFFYDNLLKDFREKPPEFVWVDENVNLEKISYYDIEPDNRDIIKVLSRDVRFFALWQNYEKVGEIEGASPTEEDIKNLPEGEKIPKPDIYSLYVRKHDK